MTRGKSGLHTGGPGRTRTQSHGIQSLGGYMGVVWTDGPRNVRWTEKEKSPGAKKSEQEAKSVARLGSAGYRRRGLGGARVDVAFCGGYCCG
jgi:hypothetical protein